MPHAIEFHVPTIFQHVLRVDHKFVLEYVNSYSLKKLADIGTSCPDHFIRTKKKPIVLNFDPSDMEDLQIKI